MKLWKGTLFGFIGLGSMLLGCGGGGSSSATSDPISTTLRSAPERQSVQGSTLKLEADLWRDFQPISPPDGKPLIGALRIITINATPFPSTLKTNAVWIVNGNDIWSAPIAEEQVAPGDATEYVTVRQGPKWAPGTQVDVIVQLRDSKGNTYLLQAHQQRIGATY